MKKIFTLLMVMVLLVVTGLSSSALAASSFHENMIGFETMGAVSKGYYSTQTVTELVFNGESESPPLNMANLWVIGKDEIILEYIEVNDTGATLWAVKPITLAGQEYTALNIGLSCATFLPYNGSFQYINLETKAIIGYTLLPIEIPEDQEMYDDYETFSLACYEDFG